MSAFQDPWDHPQTRRWVAHVQHQVFPMIDNSSTFISIVPPEPDVKAAVELGYGLLLDKPLVLVVPPGRLPPTRLARAADLVITDTDNTAVAQQIRDFTARYREARPQ